VRPSAVVTSVLFGVFLLGTLIWLANLNFAEPALGQMKLAILQQAIGLFLATASGLLLLIRAIAGDPPARLLALVLPALVGALLVQPNWGVALGLAGTSAAFALRLVFGYNRRLPPVPLPHVAPPL
jgi:hypothetical protein